MDHSYSDNELSLSPSQILERLQVLRQLQIMQRGKLQKQRLEYQGSPETSSSITEVVSHFTNSTSYNTFRSLLMSTQETSNDSSPRLQNSGLSQNIRERDLIDGVAVLNVSQGSEFIVKSPLPTRSQVSARSTNDTEPTSTKKHISLDEMPILSPKQDFETLVIEKLKNDKEPKSPCKVATNQFPMQSKKPFLRRGEGMSRFGLRKNDLVIQNTKSLPWRRKSNDPKNIEAPAKSENPTKVQKKPDVQIIITKPQDSVPMKNNLHTNKRNSKDTLKVANSKKLPKQNINNVQEKLPTKLEQSKETVVNTSACEIHSNNPKPDPQVPSPMVRQQSAGKAKTWAAILTKEQDNFLRQLKQSDYYRNFVSPAKSSVSDMSCDENLNKLRQEREIAEQNMFNLLENKVTNESFSLESSFFSKFLKSSMEYSGESTPLIMKQCIQNNPELMHIFPNFAHKQRNDSQSTLYTNNSEYTDGCDTCSSTSTCCSCKTVEQVATPQKDSRKKNSKQEDVSKTKKKETDNDNGVCQEDTEVDKMKTEMAEMNAKLVATSELLKDRLHELEDEIETFRKENASIAKMREEIDLERQKFYEEKSAFEQKFNEDKILSEYYLAEEKEKLNKQKQVYERYVREMRGRLNKKDKDEVVNLKKEISDLKEEIRIKDAKSTSSIARLRNQIKIMEKEKSTLQEQVEKLKKENRRIQHSNEISRRLTNIKYLEQINKKLNNMAKEPQSAVDLDSDIKYKAYEIERQSRSRKVQPTTKGPRPRAKSVPNLNVTSRYAKYFSQRDVVSQMEQDNELNIDTYDTNQSDNNIDYNDNEIIHSDDTESVGTRSITSENDGNNLEKIYIERFRSTSPKSNRSSMSSSSSKKSFKDNPDTFFIRKSNSNSRNSKSPNRTASPFLSNSDSGNRSKSPLTVLSNRTGRKSPQPSREKDNQFAMGDHTRAELNSMSRSKSPVSILSSRSSQRVGMLRNQDQFRDKLMNVSPEPVTSKSNLNPTEITKSDGSRELRFPNGNVKYISADKKYSKFVYYNGDVKENFYSEGRIKYYYAEAKTYHTTHADGLEVLEFPDGQVEKRYKDGSSEIRLPNGSIRYFDPKNEHVREEWRFPDGTAMTVSADDEKRVVFPSGQVEVHAKNHKRREFPDGTVKLVYNDGTSETRYASGRIRVKDKHGNLIMDSATTG